MPGGDRTGPEGQGPLTGRRMGYCDGNETPTGGFRGRGFQRGFSRGFRNRYYRRSVSPIAENTNNEEQLKEDISILKKQLETLENRLENLSKNN